MLPRLARVKCERRILAENTQRRSNRQYSRLIEDAMLPYCRKPNLNRRGECRCELPTARNMKLDADGKVAQFCLARGGLDHECGHDN